jgi:hypothetical protein
MNKAGIPANPSFENSFSAELNEPRGPLSLEKPETLNRAQNFAGAMTKIWHLNSGGYKRDSGKLKLPP